MLIRDAIPSDLPAIVRLERLTEFYTFIGMWTEEMHARQLASEENAYLVVEDDTGEVAAFAILLGIHSPDHSVELKRIVVATPGQGLGQTLLRHVAERVFKSYKAHRLYLDVFETNPRAKHIYEKFGFKVDGVLREAAYRDGEYFSLTLMSLLDREYRALHGPDA